MKHILILSSVVLIAAAFFIGTTITSDHKAESVTVGEIALGTCTITETRVAIGHQLSKEVLAADTSRQWAIIQQPLNATNTVSLSLSGAAVAGSGYTLSTTSAVTHPNQLVLGFSTPIRTGAAIQAITSTGSSTINVISCG